MSGVVLVPGEEEVGPQRLCTRCHEWWPADTEFFYWNTDRLHSWCRACWSDYNRERLVEGIDRREYQRRWKRNRRMVGGVA